MLLSPDLVLRTVAHLPNTDIGATVLTTLQLQLKLLRVPLLLRDLA